MTKGVKNQITKMDIRLKQTNFSGLKEKMFSEVYIVMRGGKMLQIYRNNKFCDTVFRLLPNLSIKRVAV